MEVDNRDLSLSFYNYLCKVVGSEDVVRTRRRIFNVDNYVSHSKQLSYISSGSKAEGLDLGGSDYYVIRIFNDWPVYENTDDIRQRRHVVSLLIDTNYTKPCYARLKLHHVNPKFCQFFNSINCGTYLSSKLLLEIYDIEKTVIHGPAISSHQSGLLDFVISFHCARWISQVDEWIYRSRSLWPQNRLIETIVQYGVLFVPVGCKSSPHADLEFRISFNVGEKILVHSFSHVQLFCYALLKIILNHFIKPQYGDLLCSYFLKTIMFWVLEETEEAIWTPQNLLRCFNRCFKRLVYCVTYSTCLHYFIPEVNFFEDRFSKSEHEALKGTLERLYNSGWQCVLETNILRSFRFFIGPSPTTMVPSVSALPFLYYTVTQQSNFYRLVFGSLHLPGKDIYAIILSKSNQMLAQRIPIHRFNNYNETNKQKYKNYRKCLSHLLQGIHHDAVSGWLLLASFFYRFEQYEQCLHILNYCLYECVPDKILQNLYINMELQQEFNIKMQQLIKNRFLRSFKRRGIDFVHLQPQSCIIPEEWSEIQYANMIQPVVFARCLHCMCLHRLTVNAARALETTLHDKTHILTITQNN